MAELIDHVEALADNIGPRSVSTEEERQASMYVAQELTNDELDVSVDEFSTPTGTRWPYAVAFGCMIAGTIFSGLGKFFSYLAGPLMFLGFLFVAAGFAIYYTEHNNRSFLASRRMNGISQNVVAKYVPSSVARERHRRKVVVVAHVDTVRSQLEASPSIVNYLPLLLKILYYVMIGLGVVLIVRILPLPWPDSVDFALWVISLIACVVPLAGLVCIIASRFTPYVAGGNDNASALAVLLGVAKRVLDPEERERFMKERSAAATEQPEVPVETLASTTGSFAPVSAEGETAADKTQVLNPEEIAEAVPVVHDAAAAEEAGVVPEGAEVIYETVPAGKPAETVAAQDDAPTIDPSATVAMPPVVSEEAEAVPEVSEAVPAEPVSGTVAVVEPAAEEEVAKPEPAVFETAEEAKPAPAPEPEPEVDHEAIRSQYAAAARERVSRQAAAVRAQRVASRAAAPAVKKDASMPSWYTTARARAAREIEQEEKEASAETSYRSRYADMPLPDQRIQAEEPALEAEPVEAAVAQPVEESAATQIVADSVASETAPIAEPVSAPEPVAVIEPASVEPEPEVAVSEPVAAESVVASAQAPESAAPEPLAIPGIDMGEGIAEVELDELEEPVEAATPEPEQAAEAAPVEEEVEAFVFDIPDDEIADISPDLSGMFTPVEHVDETTASSLTTRIPSIGNSADEGNAARRETTLEEESEVESESEVDAELEAKQAAHREELNALLESLPEAMPASDFAEEEAVETAPEAVPAPEAEESPVEKTARAPKPKIDRRKPTARRVSEDFKPTAEREGREDRALSQLRQKAAVNSDYYDTPQAGARSGFAGDDLNATTVFQPATSTNTSSFPALTGSFPALSGKIPVISDSDFGTPGAPAEEDLSADDFSQFSPAANGSIDIPESRFHNAIDKAGGLFGKLRHHRKNEDRDDFGDVENWDEDDDTGWKGGGYFSDGIGDAARERAAEIRRSVIEMTENDLLDKEVWFVALGASNSSEQGMKNFLDLHGSELRGALIINLEAVGAGDIHFVDYEGKGKPHRADRRLQTLVRKASKEVAGTEMKPKRLDWRNTDATPAMRAGARAVTIMGFDGEAPVGWHWNTDTSAVVEEENLDYVADVVLRMIENS